jgi:uncharacterized YigZ family protein
MEDTFLTLRKGAEAETKIKGSRFIGEAIPVVSEEEAEAAIAAIRKRAYTATHQCTAYRIGPAAHLFRFNDDGEPSGTAGQPILRQIEGRDLTNTLVVVTRYYGGTKLGTGGLIRAYGEAAALALDAAPVQQCILRERVRLRFGYEDTSPAMHTIGQFDAEIQETHYSEETEIVVGVRCSEVDSLLDMFTNALGGRGEAIRMGD